MPTAGPAAAGVCAPLGTGSGMGGHGSGVGQIGGDTCCTEGLPASGTVAPAACPAFEIGSGTGGHGSGGGQIGGDTCWVLAGAEGRAVGCFPLITVTGTGGQGGKLQSGGSGGLVGKVGGALEAVGITAVGIGGHPLAHGPTVDGGLVGLAVLVGCTVDGIGHDFVLT